MGILKTIALILTAVLALPLAHAKEAEKSAIADICITRPDLCGGAALPKKKKSAKKRRTGPLVDYHGNVKPKCRDASNSYDTSYDDLPICNSEASAAALEIENDLAELAEEKRKKPRKKAQKRYDNETAAGAKVNFDSYMNSNSSHPAIARQPSSTSNHQKAFVPLQRPASVSLPPLATGAEPQAPSGSSNYQPAPPSGGTPDYSGGSVRENGPPQDSGPPVH